MAEKVSAELLDFTNVRERGDYNPVHVEPGEYLMTVASVTAQDSKAGNKMWIFGFKHAAAVKGVASASQATYPYYCVLDPKSLWKVRGLALATGYNVPKSKFSLDPNRLIGRQIGVIVDDDEYEGKIRSKVVQVMPASELDEQPTQQAGDDPDADAPVGEDDLDGVDL